MNIICSIGPKIDNPESISSLYRAGMNIARYNFSHVDYDRTKYLISYIRNNIPGLKVLQDLQGNKLRVSDFFEGEVMVKPGDRVIFCSEKVYRKMRISEGNAVVVPVAFEGEFSYLYTAKVIYMKDATMKFNIINHRNQDGESEAIETRVEIGGVVRAEKGINAPGVDRSKMRLTQKDKADIIWGLQNKVDIICLSYTCSEENVIELQDFIKQNAEQDFMPKIWAKIESREGIKNIQSILKGVDGIMFGRGDLYAEIDPILIPYVQDKMMSIMKNSGKEFIIATYVLPSMRTSTMPQVSELSDIYYCIKKKVTGFMLSTEVSVGRNPVQVVETMKRMVDKYSKDEELS